jgi:hypothetical protein
MHRSLGVLDALCGKPPSVILVGIARVRMRAAVATAAKLIGNDWIMTSRKPHDGILERKFVPSRDLRKLVHLEVATGTQVRERRENVGNSFRPKR